MFHRIGIFFFAACAAVTVIAACSSEAPTTHAAGGEDDLSVVQPAFNLWSCTSLACLDLETLESSEHSYTACASVLEDAESVGVSLCEERKVANVVSRPAKCVPMGVPCPAKRAAYDWAPASAEGGASPRSDLGAIDAAAAEAAP